MFQSEKSEIDSVLELEEQEKNKWSENIVTFQQQKALNSNVFLTFIGRRRFKDAVLFKVQEIILLLHIALSFSFFHDLLSL